MYWRCTMTQLDQIRKIVAMAYNLELTPVAALAAITTALDGPTAGTTADPPEVTP